MMRAVLFLFAASGCAPTVEGDDTSPGEVADADGDGWTVEDGDCDDEKANVNPSETDLAGDGIDQNCDGVDGIDGDGDGWASQASGGEDCDDTDPSVFPGAEDEPYDGIDADCAGDEGEYDVDGDGDDCDDTDPLVHPGAEEDLSDAVDQDCDGVAQFDLDGDGWVSEATGGDDCDDTDPLVHPGAWERPDDGVDQDCDGADRGYEGLVLDEGGTEVATFTTEVGKKLDVAFLMDTTGSMSGAFSSLDVALVAAEVATVAPDVAYGLATFDDYAYGGYGSASYGDIPFAVAQPITDDLAEVEDAVDALATHGGSDAPESSMEALYQVLTGAGHDQNCDGSYSSATDVLPFLASTDDPFGGSGGESYDATTSGGGMGGGLGFREGAVPLVVYVTDNYMRDPDDGYGTPGGCPQDAGFADVVGAAEDLGAVLVGVAWNSTIPVTQMEALALATGSQGDLDGDGIVDSDFVLSWSGSGLETDLAAIAGAVQGAARYAEVWLEVEGDDWGIVTAIDPESYTDVDVSAATGLSFDVTLSGEVPAIADEQEITLTFTVVGDGAALDSWDLVLLIPPG